MRTLRPASLVAALILAPALLAAQSQPLRLAPGACDWGHQRDVSWGRRVLAFSSEGRGGANRATGRPDVFPALGEGDPFVVAPLVWEHQGGEVWERERGGVWPEWIAIGLRQPVAARELWLFVTGGAGAEMRIAVFEADGSMLPVAHLPAVALELEDQVAQIVVPLDTAIVVSGIRVEIEPSWFLLDAVAAVPRRVCAPPLAEPDKLPPPLREDAR